MVWRRVLVPSHYIFDLGTSHAIYSRLHLDLILERPSPIIFMRAEKNKIERANMRRARTLDAIAMCQAMSLLERRVSPINFKKKNLFLNAISHISVRKR